jgi:pimeloyl-ACP methyl ester carboxylesterase
MKDREIFNRNWARENVYGRYVSNAAKRTSSSTGQAIGGYVTTAIVVRDMVQIIEAHGLWRATRAEHLLRGRWDDEARKAKARTRWVPGEEVLNFYGMSYGTALGQEFATLQPHRIGRVVLDGVVDVQDYTDGGWTTNLNNADAITAKFAQHCIEAGDGCPISSWAGPGKDPVLLTSLIYSTITDLKEEPIASIFPEDESSIPEISTYSDAMLTLFLMWYRAAETFPVAASFLADIRARRAQSMWFYHSPISCPAAGHKMEDINAVSIAIRCTDAGSQTNTTKADFQSTLQTLQSQSPVFSDYWASLPMPCYGFELPEPDGQPIWRYPGPFGAKTANPILFASSALDPVTPLGNAEHAAEKLFPGAGLMVITDGAGHGSLSWPSTCAANAVSRYFATGDVGNGRIECKGDIDPFAPAGMKIMEGADMEVVAAIQGVKGALDRMGMGLGHSSDQSRMALRM